MARVFEGLSIGGRSATRRMFEDLNPADGSVWAGVPDCGRAETAAAIEAAHAAFAEWSALPFTSARMISIRWPRSSRSASMEIVEALQAEGGGWFGKGMFETGYVPEVFRAAAASVLAVDRRGDAVGIRQAVDGGAPADGRGLRHQPVELPVPAVARGFAFPLAAGNTIVLKPSEETPYCGGLLFAEVFEEAGLPEGVFNVVTCSRDNVQEVGDELIEHPCVKGISFTGSTAVGRQIAAQAGAHLKKCCVELGGKDSLIVCDDADMERATQAANFGSFMHQGQICMSVEKVLVHEKIFDHFLKRFVERAPKLQGRRSDQRQGAHHRPADQRQAGGQGEGADRRRDRQGREGGARRQDRGRFVEPTILLGVTPRHEALPGRDLRPGGAGDPVPHRRRSDRRSPTTPNTACRRA